MRIFLCALLAGCSAPPPAIPAGPVALTLEDAALQNNVPRDLLLAIAAEEGGLRLRRIRALDERDEVPVAGALELRHGRFDSLARGAALMGTTEEALRVDTDLATAAGARVLAELGQQIGAEANILTSWRDAVAELSGLLEPERSAYVERVYDKLRSGGSFAARENERVFLPAHPDLPVAELGVRRQAANGTPDFPGAIWFDTSCTNKCTPGRPDGNDSVNKIVIHDTEGGWNASVATLQFDSGKSVHYIIDADGSRVGQFRPETDTTWHAGNFFYNKTSIGIEHVGFVADPDGYAPALYDKSVELVKSIRSRWQVPLDRAHIVGHYQIPDGTQISESSPACALTLDACETSADYGGASNHRDPGYHWMWCQFMESLGGSCACNDAYKLWNCTTDKTEAVRCPSGTVEIDHCSAGCEVKPLGVDDVCNYTPAPMPSPSMEPVPSMSPVPSPSMPPVPSPSMPPPGIRSAKLRPEIENAEGGCAVATGAPSGAWMILLLAIARRRRRSHR